MAQRLFARLHARHPNLQLDALAQRPARKLAACGYGTAYVLPNSLKWSIVPFMAGIPRRIGFTGEARYGLINVRHDLDKETLSLMVESFAQLAEAPGAPLPKAIFHPKIRSTATVTRPDSRSPSWPRLAKSMAPRYSEYTYLIGDSGMATSIRLAPETEQRLDYLASQTRRTKAYYLRAIIKQGIDEMEDYYLAADVLERVRKRQEAVHSSSDVRSDLGLCD